MKAGRAFAAGMAGGAVMSVLMWMARSMIGLPANLEMMLGTMVAEPGSTAWKIGFAIHLMLSGSIALIYGWGFERVTHRAGWRVGTSFGIVHAIIAGMLMGMMPMMHPRMPSPVPAPGAFMSNLGTMGVVAEFMMHMIFGAVVGAIYGAVLHPRAAELGNARALP